MFRMSENPNDQKNSEDTESQEMEKQIAVMLLPILQDAQKLYSSYGPSHVEYVEKTNKKIHYLQNLLTEEKK